KTSHISQHLKKYMRMNFQRTDGYVDRKGHKDETARSAKYFEIVPVIQAIRVLANNRRVRCGHARWQSREQFFRHPFAREGPLHARSIPLQFRGVHWLRPRAMESVLSHNDNSRLRHFRQ